MIPTREEQKAISRLREGTLREVPFPVLLGALAIHHRTVLLEIRHNQLEKRIVFESGAPVECESNLAHETLGRFMVSKGKLSASDFNTAIAKSASRQVPISDILLESELVNPFDLFKLLQQLLAKKLLDCFSWSDGAFQMSFDVPEVESSLKVKVPQLILTGIMKFAPQRDVDSSIVPLIGKKLAVAPTPPFGLDEVRLSASQSALIDALGQPKRIDELAMASNVPYEDITRWLYAMSLLGFVVPGDHPTPQRPQPQRTPSAEFEIRPVAAPPVVAAEAPRPLRVTEQSAEPVAGEREKNEIMAAYLTFRRHDAFALLGLTETAAIPEIEAAYLRYAQKFAPWRLATPELRSLQEKAHEMFLAGARAVAVLSDTEQRTTLIHRRKTLQEEKRRAATANQFALKTDLLDPEVQYRKGLGLMETGKFADAVKFFEFAADCDPQNGAYRAELAHSRFRLSPAGGAQQALEELQQAMRIDPECGIAAYYAGELCRVMGKPVEAERYLRLASKMMAPDRRPIEALKLLTSSAKK